MSLNLNHFAVLKHFSHWEACTTLGIFTSEQIIWIADFIIKSLLCFIPRWVYRVELCQKWWFIYWHWWNTQSCFQL